MNHRTSRFLAVVVGAGLALGASSGAPAASSGAGSEESARIRRVENGLGPRVPIAGEPGWTLADRMARYRVPGVSVAVFHDFQLAWARGYGVRDVGSKDPVTPHTLLQAASIEKPVTAAVVLGLAEAGKLGLDADVNTLLRSWKVPANEWTRAKAVTPRLLLSHSAGVTVHGFPGYASGEPIPTRLQILNGQPPANTDPVVVDQEPGQKYRYSGGGYTILQQMMEDVSGVGYDHLVRGHVLSPLRMTDSVIGLSRAALRGHELASGHRPDGTGLPGQYHLYSTFGGGGLWTTASDLARFALGVQRARRGDSGVGISRNAATLMTTKVTDQTGLGFFFVKERYFEHGGSNEGFVGRLVGHLDRGYGAVILTNSDNGGPLINEILDAIAAEYGWENWTRETPVQVARVDPASLDRYCGRYQLGSDMITEVSRTDGGRLRGVPSFGEPFDLIPIASDRFVRRDTLTRYRFAPGGEAVERMSPAGKVWGRDPRVVATTAVALQYVEEGNVSMAVEAYRRLRAEAQPDDPTGSEDDLAVWGFQLFGNQDFKRAAALLEVASILYPSSVKIWFGLGEARLWSGHTEEARVAFRRAVSSDRGDQVTPADVKQEFVSLASSRLREIARREQPRHQ